MRPDGPGRRAIAHMAYEAAGCDPLLALALVCDLIKSGQIRASRLGIVLVEPSEVLAA